MGRQFIEFVQSQWLPWRTNVLAGQRAALEVKVLSRDDDDGASSMLLRYPPSWCVQTPEPIAADEEFFVLRGRLSRDGTDYGLHDYAYLPAGHQAGLAAGPEGAIVMTYFSATPEPITNQAAAQVHDPDRVVSRIETLLLPWDRTNMDPHIDHLHPFRKNLRLAPDGSGRTYLLGGLPQGFPASGDEPLERHPHNEEMFMISGDMPCSRGVMRAGAYFWRPPGIWHGADCSVTGFLLLMRTPGVNATVSEWSDTPHTVRVDPPFDPALPPGMDPSTVAPLRDPVEY
jgi:hypothetical protein